MKNKVLIIFIFFISVYSNSISQENSIYEWKTLINNLKLTQEKINEHAAHFPILIEFNSSKELNKSLKKWNKKFPLEWNVLDAHLEISKDYSPVYLGVLDSDQFVKYLESKSKNSWLEWIEASNITDRRLHEVAPNFPIEFKDVDKSAFEQKITWWKTIYSHEYEALINAPELTSLNPYYKEYVDVVQIPYFIGPIISYEKPLLEDTGDKFNDDLNFQLKLMNWYYLFELDQFKNEFGFFPEFDEHFDEEKYKYNIVTNIEFINKEKQSKK